MKKLLIFISLFLSIRLCYAQDVKQGIFFNGGLGHLRNVAVAFEGEFEGESEFKHSTDLGYKFRYYSASKLLFQDFDASLGMKRFTYSYHQIYKEGESDDPHWAGFHPSGNISMYNVSLNYSINYKVYRNLFLGAGLGSTVSHTGNKVRVDLPLSLRIGYDYKRWGWAFSYKYGLFNTMNITDAISKGKINEATLQVFISLSQP